MTEADTATEVEEGPCAGYRIVDFTTVVSGPWCTQALGDLGADVIKVETPIGDISRLAGGTPRAGLSPYFVQLNRNKRSIVIDLKTEAGARLARTLAGGADVVIENFRPGVADRLGIGYEVVRPDNPGLIYVAISGFGPTGPYVDQPAYDHVIQGLSGVMPGQGGAGGPRLLCNVAADKVAAQTALSAVLAALLARQRRGGEGQRIDVPMLDAYAAFILPESVAPRTFPPDVSTLAGTDNLFRTWPTADGFVVGFPMQDDQYAGLCRALGREDWLGDDRFASLGQRFTHLEELGSMLEPELRRHTTASFIESARREGVPFAPVNEVEDFLDDPQVAHSEIVQEFEDEAAGPIRMLRPPVRYERTPARRYRPPPRLGEHTDEILREAAHSEEEIEGLREQGVVHGPRSES